MTRTTKLFAAAALGIVLGASACHNDDLFRPVNFTPVDPLFERYVSLGNSITAGFQSGGINDSTQRQAYPVLLAGAMGSPFFYPSMALPGCPPPFTNVFTQTRVSGGTSTTCALRKAQTVPPPYISNTAVPGAEVLDPYNNLDTASNSNALTTFFLGGLTQTQMMMRAHPTFVTVWIGNNDVLGAATNSANGGDSTKITPVATFQSRYAGLIDSIEAAGPQRAVLIGVANVTGIPFFSRGSTYLGAKLANQLPALMTVTANCAPPRGDSVLVPFPFGAALIGAAAAGVNDTLYCTEPQTVQPAELRKLVTTVTAYNAYIANQASLRTWVYYDPNTALDSLRTVATAVRAFPLIGQPCSANPFGTAFSCDGVHPSAATHRLIANKLRMAINTAYGKAIPLTF
jgi:lysophospholipase L1-like esterase